MSIRNRTSQYWHQLTQHILPTVASRRFAMAITLLLVALAAACGTSTPPPRSSPPPATAAPTTGRATTAPTTVPTGAPTAPLSGITLNGPAGIGGPVLPWLSVYFTNPNPPDNMVGGVDQVVVSVLNTARKTIDLATFDFTLPSVADALVAASKRGVKVRVIVDDKNGEQELKQDDLLKQIGGQPFEKLKTAGIPVVGGGRSNGLMHNKFIIVDSVTVFMGSWNDSYNDTFRNNNNLLMITSQKLVENYQAKFNEGFEKNLFGAKAQVTSPNPKMTLSGVDVEQYFSPDDKVMDKLIAEVGKATKSVKFMAFTYTDKGLSAAMIARFKAGLTVQGVIENRGASQGALVPLFCAQVPVLTDGNKYTMHHKVIIIDDSTVVTGSFNFTNSADTANDDNVIIIRSPEVARLYLAEFARVYGAGVKPNPTGIDCTKAN